MSAVSPTPKDTEAEEATRMREALRLIAAGGCSNRTVGRCSDDPNRSPVAQYTAEKWCDECIAANALGPVLAASPAVTERPEGPEVAERLATARLLNPEATEYEVGWRAGWDKGRAAEVPVHLSRATKIPAWFAWCDAGPQPDWVFAFQRLAATCPDCIEAADDAWRSGAFV